MQAADGQTFCFGVYTLDLRRGSLRAGNREIELRPKSFAMLCYLVENAGRLISKDELIKAVWPNATVADGLLARCASDVRLALGDADQRIIKTLLRRGYLFAAPVSTGVSENAMPPAGPPDRLQAEPEKPLPTSAGVASPRSLPRLSLLALPFVSESERGPGAGLSGSILLLTPRPHRPISRRIRDSFVIARTTAFTYKGKAVDVKRIGQELGVRYILEGSAQQSGHAGASECPTRRCRYKRASLGRSVRCRSGRPVLGQMQDEIVTRLARALEMELAAVEAAHISRTRSANL